MIHAEQFVEQAKKLGFRSYAGVPCSYLTPFINYVIDEQELSYISASNEGDAVAIAAGVTLGGQRGVAMMQNSGLGNAVSPLTSLTWTFRIPVLLIVTLRGDPEFSDEPQHKLMGPITTSMLETMQIPWEYFPVTGEEILPVLQRADAYMREEGRPYALVMRKGSVAPCALKGGKTTGGRTDYEIRFRYDTGIEKPSRSSALQRIITHTDSSNSVVIATTGFTGRELFALDDRPNQLYMVGSMGCASALGLGLAQARPDLQIVIVEGDGAALMRMGNFASVGTYAGDNLLHIVLDNEVHDSTGAQATVSAGVSFAGIAKACGYSCCWEGNDVALLEELFAATGISGPRFAQLKTQPGTMDNLPRPDITPEQVRERFMRHIG
jgi:phosphonopyruvate decarboxylase